MKTKKPKTVENKYKIYGDRLADEINICQHVIFHVFHDTKEVVYSEFCNSFTHEVFIIVYAESVNTDDLRSFSAKLYKQISAEMKENSKILSEIISVYDTDMYDRGGRMKLESMGDKITHSIATNNHQQNLY